MRKKWTKFISFVLVLMIVIGMVPITTNAVTNSSSFWVEFIDVGQGDSALIQCDGHYLMIDGGPSDASSIVYTILKNKGISYID